MSPCQVKDRHAGEMAQRRIATGSGQRDRMKADFLVRSGKHMGIQRGRNHLGAEADAEGRKIPFQPESQAPELAGNPGMAVLLVNTRGAAHHDDEIVLGEIERGKVQVRDVDAVKYIACCLHGDTKGRAVASDASRSGAPLRSRRSALRHICRT